MKTVITILGLMTVLSGCSKEVTDTMYTSNAMSLDALTATDLIGSWKFKSYSDNQKVSYEVTLEFKNERSETNLPILSGRASVNFYTATYEPNSSKKTIKISTIGSTKMAGEPAAMNFETVYLNRLSKAMSYDFKDKNTLIIYLSEPTKEVMYFEKN